MPNAKQTSTFGMHLSSYSKSYLQSKMSYWLRSTIHSSTVPLYKLQNAHMKFLKLFTDCLPISYLTMLSLIFIGIYLPIISSLSFPVIGATIPVSTTDTIEVYYPTDCYNTHTQASYSGSVNLCPIIIP